MALVEVARRPDTRCQDILTEVLAKSQTSIIRGVAVVTVNGGGTVTTAAHCSDDANVFSLLGGLEHVKNRFYQDRLG